MTRTALRPADGTPGWRARLDRDAGVFAQSQQGQILGAILYWRPLRSFGSCAASKRGMRSAGRATSFSERSIAVPKMAAAAIGFESRVYSDQTRYSIKGGCSPLASN